MKPCRSQQKPAAGGFEGVVAGHGRNDIVVRTENAVAKEVLHVSACLLQKGGLWEQLQHILLQENNLVRNDTETDSPVSIHCIGERW